MGVRGLLAFELHANGARRDVHSGNYGGIVPNPIWTLVQLLATMKGPAGEITIEGFGETLVPPTPQERAAAGKLPIDVAAVRAELGIAQFDAPAGRDYFERLMFQPTLTINGLHGGYGGPGMKTVIPCEAFAKCDMRLVAPQSTGCVFDLVTRHVARHAPGVQVVRTNGMEPSKTPITSPYTALIAAAIGLAQGRAPLLYPSLGGSLPNHVFTGTLGLPTFVVPYANADQCNHAPDENLRIACFLAGVRTGAALLAVLGEHGPAVHGQAAVPFGQAAAGPRPTIAAATS
jgi:acetylornithine deacetylase/succinyl-diaminopimelate desuccinylase-like protein